MSAPVAGTGPRLERVLSTTACFLRCLLSGEDARHMTAQGRVSAARLAPTSGEVITQFQADSSRTDSPVRILHAQPGSPVSGNIWVRKMLATLPRLREALRSL